MIYLESEDGTVVDTYQEAEMEYKITGIYSISLPFSFYSITSIFAFLNTLRYGAMKRGMKEVQVMATNKY